VRDQAATRTHLAKVCDHRKVSPVHSPLVLASASPVRLRVLRSAGFNPKVVVSGVTEDIDTDQNGTAIVVATLAERKAATVANRLHDSPSLVLGCDSLLDLNGLTLGKPTTPREASETWEQLSGNTGVLHTGHCLIDTVSRQALQKVGSTVIRFGRPTDSELAAYIASGEPLRLAGGFSIEGLCAPFIEGIDGDPSNVLGLSLPILRSMLAQLGIAIPDLWHSPRIAADNRS